MKTKLLESFLIILLALGFYYSNAFSVELTDWEKQQFDNMLEKYLWEQEVFKSQSDYYCRDEEYQKCFRKSYEKASKLNRFFGKYGDECPLPSLVDSYKEICGETD